MDFTSTNAHTIEFIVFYLLFNWVMFILYKNNWIFNKLEGVAIKLGKNTRLGWFFDELSQCKFCIENWLGTIAAIFYSAYLYDYNYLFWGVLCASISSWKRM